VATFHFIVSEIGSKNNLQPPLRTHIAGKQKLYQIMGSLIAPPTNFESYHQKVQ
jgi:hypothetical protein